MKNKPLISVIVPAYNEQSYIAKCLDSLLNQDLEKKLYEIIVIDNASTDKTAQIVKEKGIRVMKESRKGNAYARAKGVEETNGEIIAFTDADCIVPKKWLSQLLLHFQKDKNLDAVGGVFSFYDGSKFLQLLMTKIRPFVWHLSGGNMAIRRKSLVRIGGFDLSIHAGEDVLITLKIQKTGKLRIDKNIIVPTSARRLSKGFLAALITYFPNDLWLKLFKKPLFTRFSDIR